MNRTDPKPEPTPEWSQAERKLRRRNLRTALFLLVLVLASLASVLYEFGVFGKR